MKTPQLLNEFSLLVDSIYEAALEPGLWTVAVKRIAHIHKSDKALLFTPQLAPALGGFVFPHGLSETSLLEWGNRYIDLDIWTQSGIRLDLAVGQAVLDTDLAADATLLASPFYQQFLSRHDIRRLCTGMVFAHNDTTLPFTGCSIYGPHSRGAFDDHSRQIHHLTLNHLSRALGTMIRLRDAELRLASTLAALNRLSGNILLLDQKGKVIFANDAAQRLLDRCDGLSLSTGTGGASPREHLKAWQRTDDGLVGVEVARATRGDPSDVEHFNHSIRIRRPSGKQPLILQITPLSERNPLATADRQAWAVAFITDPDASVVLREDVAKSQYGLTPAETRLANALLAGHALDDISRRTGTRSATLRTQLQNLFVKTGTNRQAELVKLLMSVASHP